MFTALCRRSVLEKLKANSNAVKRFFLSDAFKCTEAWEKRLRDPVFQKLNLGQLYTELDKNVSIGWRINVLDVDLFANGIKDDSYQNELEDILFKLRANPETSIMLESTQHAVIRWYLSLNKASDLLNVLSQRQVFGIFPDTYLVTYMMDKFLKEGDAVTAVKVAVLQMLQEDCNHPIMRSLALYSCVKYLDSPDVWQTPLPEPVDEDEEVVKVRVKFIRNEYFDEHFDIVDTNHLVGKTMMAFGKALGGVIGNSAQLLGMILYDKFEEAKLFLSEMTNANQPVFKDTVEKAVSYLKCKPKQEGESNGGEGKESESNEGERNVETSDSQPIQVELEKLLKGLSSSTLQDGDLESELKKCIEKEVGEHEKQMIQDQCEIYDKWEKYRTERIQQEIVEQTQSKLALEIEDMKKELAMEEQRLFFFENETEYNDIIDEHREKKANFRYFVPVGKIRKKTSTRLLQRGITDSKTPNKSP